MNKWYEAGMPWHAFNVQKGDDWSHMKFKEALRHLETLPLPSLEKIDKSGPNMLREKFDTADKPLKLCNNMDSLLAPASDGKDEFRYTFDHAHAWHSGPRVQKWDGGSNDNHPPDASYNKPLAMNFLRNVGNNSHPCPLCPSINIDSQVGGGTPESRDAATVARLKQQPLHFLTMHYQGAVSKIWSTMYVVLFCLL